MYIICSFVLKRQDIVDKLVVCTIYIFALYADGEYLKLHTQDIKELVLPPEELIGKKLIDVF